jgi:hypothetical protein
MDAPASLLSARARTFSSSVSASTFPLRPVIVRRPPRIATDAPPLLRHRGTRPGLTPLAVAANSGSEVDTLTGYRPTSTGECRRHASIRRPSRSPQHAQMCAVADEQPSASSSVRARSRTTTNNADPGEAPLRFDPGCFAVWSLDFAELGVRLGQLSLPRADLSRRPLARQLSLGVRRSTPTAAPSDPTLAAGASAATPPLARPFRSPRGCRSAEGHRPRARAGISLPRADRRTPARLAARSPLRYARLPPAWT